MAKKHSSTKRESPLSQAGSKVALEPRGCFTVLHRRIPLPAARYSASRASFRCQRESVRGHGKCHQAVATSAVFLCSEVNKPRPAARAVSGSRQRDD